MSASVLAWLSAFGLTQAVELPIYLRALREDEPVIERLPAAIAVAFGASALTHPIVWFVFPTLISGSWLSMVLVAELFAIAAEAAWLRGFGLRRALAWAAFANAASVLVGLASRALFDWP
ncbi:MAG: hypothetical protein R6X02_04895 [Enhygromyxa sp.]